MPRQGITAEQITAAIEALEARGEPVTQLSIRKELGNTGSLGTISSFLRTLRQGKADPGPQPVPAAIPESIQAGFGKAWSLAMATAREELAPQRVALDQETAAIRALLAQTQAENDEAIRVLDLQMDLLTNQLVEANAREQVAQTRVAELSESLGYHRAQLEALAAQYHDEMARKDAVIAGQEKHLAELACNVTNPTLTD